MGIDSNNIGIKIDQPAENRNMFDMEIVHKQIISAYSSISDSLFSHDGYFDLLPLDDIIYIFDYYYSAFFSHFGKSHMCLTNKRIEEIIKNLSFIESEEGVLFDLDVEGYVDMIDRYFEIQFKDGCNYSIVHFMSVRLYRYYEVCY